MSTDDRDIESSNPSKNFKVGDFDQLSGFFTPVWESKRRIRSEPPAPPSSKGGSSGATPSSKSTAPPPPPEALASGPGAAPTKTSKDAAVPRPRPSSASRAGRSPAVRAATPVPPAPSSERPSATAEPAGSAPLLPPAVAEVFGAPAAQAPEAGAQPADPAATPRRPAALEDLGPGARGSAPPSAAARALRDAGPNLPPAAFLDQEPEVRAPRARAARADAPRADEPRAEARIERPAAQYRAQRASIAATRIAEQLKAKLQAEAAELDESRFDLAPETNRDPLAAETAEDDPFPLSLMRRLRRTIRLSTPVPDPVRSLISKYDRG